MPHIWIEYSANIATRVEQAKLTAVIHQAAVDSGVFPVGGIRTRSRRIDDYCVADGHPDNGFVHIVARIAPGRDQQTKEGIGETLFGALKRAMQPLYDSAPLGLSLEVQELDTRLNFRHNNLQEYADRRVRES